MKYFLASSMFLAGIYVQTASASPFTEIRIGDIDGFGYGVADGFVGADGLAANRNGTRFLDNGDALPDLNRDRVTATGSSDDFDNRTANEVSDNLLTGSGFVDEGSRGSRFTDIALSTSYDDSAAINRVFNANTGTYGSGGPFPAGDPDNLSNQPGFVFDFFVAAADIASGTDVFFNLVFGDYDVIPADLRFLRADGTTISQAPNLTTINFDGRIQSAFATLAFGDVFTAVTGGFSGFLAVDFLAPNEPYTAFDYVELSVDPIDIQVPVSQPITALFLGIGLIGLGLRLRPRLAG